MLILNIDLITSEFEAFVLIQECISAEGLVKLCSIIPKTSC